MVIYDTIFLKGGMTFLLKKMLIVAYKYVTELKYIQNRNQN